MFKLLLVISLVFITGCKANESLVDPLNPKFDLIYFNVVQKQLVIDQELPKNLKNLVSNWFDEKIKINGFEGEMELIISDYSEEVSIIDNGKKIESFMSFILIINKSNFPQKNIIKGTVSSYGTLTGDFSLNEFDNLVNNTHSDLILRLSHDLKSKI